MANTPLPTNLVDEVLDTTMNGKKQYTRIDNPNGTVSFRDDSVYTTVGSKLTAALVNNLCARSNEADNSLYITGDSKNIKFGKDGDGNYGYYKGDGTFTPFSSGEDIGFIAPLFSDTETYYKHDLVIYNDLLYQLTDDTFTGTWDSTKWLEITLTDMEEKESNYIAPPYDSTSTYNTDDVVYHKGVVYKCIEDNITGEFNIFKWQDITLSDLNSNLGGIIDAQMFSAKLNGSVSESSAVELYSKTLDRDCSIDLTSCVEAEFGYGYADRMNLYVNGTKIDVTSAALNAHSSDDRFGVATTIFNAKKGDVVKVKYHTNGYSSNYYFIGFIKIFI